MSKLCTFLIAVALCATLSSPAWAIMEFQKAFLQTYAEKHPDKEFSEFLSKKAKCFICHQGRKSKHNRNVYGQELAKLLDKKTDKKDEKKIAEALAKVGKMPSDPKNKDSKTFAELIAASKLPGGELEELMKEPPQSDKDKQE
ncbi:MAG: hypothetical protein KDA61_22915 [Planctomycetales bacterium]|nr:hypothetical protein [Planctomycetales bacterium]